MSTEATTPKINEADIKAYMETQNKKNNALPSRKAISDYITKMTEKHHFTYIDDTKRLYRYQDGVYVPDAVAFIGADGK